MSKPKEQRESCMFAKHHKEGPENYIDRADWFKEMAKTHRQTQCPACGLWAIWVPKKKSR